MAIQHIEFQLSRAELARHRFDAGGDLLIQNHRQLFTDLRSHVHLSRRHWTADESTLARAGSNMGSSLTSLRIGGGGSSEDGV